MYSRIVIFALMVIAVSNECWAQDAPDEEVIEEIIVTATAQIDETSSSGGSVSVVGNTNFLVEPTLPGGGGWIEAIDAAGGETEDLDDSDSPNGNEQQEVEEVIEEIVVVGNRMVVTNLPFDHGMWFRVMRHLQFAVPFVDGDCSHYSDGGWCLSTPRIPNPDFPLVGDCQSIDFTTAPLTHDQILNYRLGHQQLANDIGGFVGTLAGMALSRLGAGANAGTTIASGVAGFITGQLAGRSFDPMVMQPGDILAGTVEVCDTDGQINTNMNMQVVPTGGGTLGF